MTRAIPLKAGTTFGRWTLLADVPSLSSMGRWRCECGTEKEMPVKYIAGSTANSKSCGYLNSEITADRNRNQPGVVSKLVHPFCLIEGCSRPNLTAGFCSRHYAPNEIESEGTRICNRCGISQDLTEFRANPRHVQGRERVCRSCHATYAKEYKQETDEDSFVYAIFFASAEILKIGTHHNHSRALSSAKSRLKRKHGLSSEDGVEIWCMSGHLAEESLTLGLVGLHLQPAFPLKRRLSEWFEASHYSAEDLLIIIKKAQEIILNVIN